MRGSACASAHWQAQRWWIVAAAALALAALVCGQASVNIHPMAGLALGVLQPIIVAAVAAVLLALTADGWRGFSRLRVWAHLVSGAWLSIPLSFLIEVIAVGAIGLAVLIALAILMPDPLIEFTRRYQSLEDLDMTLILGWALQPWAIALALIVAALIVPMIEELMKPIGVAIVARRRPSPMAAYLGGVMGGLGFAFTETLGNLINITDPWIVLIVARMGTMAMHGFTSGLVGWGWGQLAAKRPWRLVGAYAGAVALHGLWNSAVVIVVFSGLYFQQTPNPDPAAAILIGSAAAVCALLLLLLVPTCVAGMAWVGYRLRTTDRRSPIADH
ncbi:MAG: PrsW family intramembrane metalloprotease [Chloroflexi bacterium]|nr:PrsW family intramembrane metalloprotease [Chloroflexota bacterium]